MMMMITAFWSNECPCCHDKDQTDNNGNQKNDQKNNNISQCIQVIFHHFIKERLNVLSPHRNPSEASDVNIRGKPSFNNTRTSSCSPCSGRRTPLSPNHGATDNGFVRGIYQDEHRVDSTVRPKLEGFFNLGGGTTRILDPMIGLWVDF